ncbi:twin-arginine translocase TatA/TatE family subunit [bacterium]|nr:twin-arginine translocase TatA/TatE family subunit [bacterium]
MFGIGMGELLVVLVVALLLFGASRLPEIGKALGRAIREFKKAGKEIKSDFEETEDKKQEEPKEDKKN